MKILFLNPPAKKHIIREYFCSLLAKTNYSWPQLDFIVMSGFLQEHSLRLVDCLLDRLSPDECFRRITKINPDLIISLTAKPTAEQDMKFLKNLKENLGCKIVVTGDIVHFDAENFMKKYKFIDGAIKDFRNPEIALKVNSNERFVIDCIGKNAEGFSYPVPEHLMFPLSKYKVPIQHERRFTCVLSSFGCRFGCPFCNYGSLGYGEREIDNFISELMYLESVGIKEFFLRDYTFNGNLKRAKEICKQIIYERIKLRWWCEIRIDIADPELLDLMKKAGCHTIMFGIETASNEKINAKVFNFNKLRKLLKNCRNIGLNTLGHFIIGLPWESERDILNTIRLAKNLDIDYASFNVFNERIGSKLENSSSCKLSSKRIRKMHRRAVISFYLRPKQIFRILLKSNYVMLKNMFENFSYFLKK